MGLLTAPFRGLFFVFREIAKRAEEELYDETAVMAELTDLYKRLETNSLSEEEFSRREASLVRRLEAIEHWKNRGQGHGVH
jgi:gas vesicle protein GvpG